MTKFLIPATVAFSVLAITSTGLVTPIQQAEAASCKKYSSATKRTNCETRERRKLRGTQPIHNYVGGSDFALKADPGGNGGGRK